VRGGRWDNKDQVGVYKEAQNSREKVRCDETMPIELGRTCCCCLQTTADHFFTAVVQGVVLAGERLSWPSQVSISSISSSSTLRLSRSSAGAEGTHSNGVTKKRSPLGWLDQPLVDHGLAAFLKLKQADATDNLQRGGLGFRLG
jgi:hypothetical protein